MDYSDDYTVETQVAHDIIDHCDINEYDVEEFKRKSVKSIADEMYRLGYFEFFMQKDNPRQKFNLTMRLRALKPIIK